MSLYQSAWHTNDIFRHVHVIEKRLKWQRSECSVTALALLLLWTYIETWNAQVSRDNDDDDDDDDKNSGKTRKLMFWLQHKQIPYRLNQAGKAQRKKNKIISIHRYQPKAYANVNYGIRYDAGLFAFHWSHNIVQLVFFFSLMAENFCTVCALWK